MEGKMKTIVEKEIGGDGAKAGLYLDDGKLKAEVSYPVAKVVEAIVKPLDPLKEKLKALIPGNWDDPLVESAFEGAKTEIVKLLSE